MPPEHLEEVVSLLSKNHKYFRRARNDKPSIANNFARSSAANKQTTSCNFNGMRNKTFNNNMTVKSKPQSEKKFFSKSASLTNSMKMQAFGSSPHAVNADRPPVKTLVSNLHAMQKFPEVIQKVNTWPLNTQGMSDNVQLIDSQTYEGFLDDLEFSQYVERMRTYSTRQKHSASTEQNEENPLDPASQKPAEAFSVE